MKTYNLALRDDGGCTHDVTIEAGDDDQAIEKANQCAAEEAEDWCADGEWGDDGANVRVRWTLTNDAGEALDSDYVTVKIEPNHESKIAAVVPYYDQPEGFCGHDPDDHDWTSEGEGGCDENPGVWSTGGTSMVFKSHCAKCGLRRTEYWTGPQRNPGEHDTVEYTITDHDTATSRD